MSRFDPNKDSLEVNLDDESKSSVSSVKFGQKTVYKPKTKKKVPRAVKSKAVPKYFSAGAGVNDTNQRDLLVEPSPFKYPNNFEEFAHKIMTKAWRNELRIKELDYKYNEKHNLRTRNQADLLNRLYVKEPEIRGLKTMQDLDADFYKIVEGRPITNRIFVQDYIHTMRDVLRTKIVTGFREDDTLLLEKKVELEQQIIDQIKKNFQAYVAAFEEFLYKDHTTSMNFLKEADKAAVEAKEKYEEYLQLAKQYGALVSIMYATEEKWRNCQLYQKFLFCVSPMAWRKQYDPNYVVQTVASEASSLFIKYRSDADENRSIEDLIKQFKEDTTKQKEPILYFTEPDQLLEVFRFMELQNLNSLLHCEELAIPLETVKENMRTTRDLYNMEIKELQDTIDNLAGSIGWEEDRAAYLEELAKELLNGEFKTLLINEDFLNLQVLVEDVYETGIGPNDANLSMAEMMKQVEIKFREQLLKLDRIPSEVVSKVESATYLEESRIMRIAQQAARKLAEVEQLIKRLNKVFTPPYQRTTKDLKWRSPPVNPPKPPPPPPRVLTQEECEYLEFFTTFCKYTDDPKDFGIDTMAAFGKAKEDDESESTLSDNPLLDN